MSIVLGIDTGGTFTDGVVINLDTKEILASTKSSTTHQDLMIGIHNTINQLPQSWLEQVDYLALSTTLALSLIHI